jgi:hypothetical protein
LYGFLHSGYWQPFVRSSCAEEDLLLRGAEAAEKRRAREMCGTAAQTFRTPLRLDEL